MSASRAVCRGFAPQLGHTKDHEENGTNCLPAWHTCVRVECGTIYGNMHLKDILGSIRVLYPGPGFISSATWPKITVMDYSIHQLYILGAFHCSIHVFITE